MSNDEQSRGRHRHYRTHSRPQRLPDYRPVVEAPVGRMLMPARCTVAIEVTGEPGLGHVEIDVELVGRQYLTTRLEALPSVGFSLDVEALRRLDVPSFLRNELAHLVIYESADGERYTAERRIEDPDPLWPVALTYSVAHALGESPTAAVAEEERISHGAAAQRVKRARDAGYLPPTTRGRAS